MPQSDAPTVAAWVLGGCWLVLLTVCMAVNAACGYDGVPAAIHMMARDPASALATQYATRQWGLTMCPSVPTIAVVSPRGVADPLVVLGPAPMWLLLLLYVFSTPHHRLIGPVIVYMLAFLACIMPVRYLHDLVPFDPSGHTLVFGVQLLPLFVVLSREHAALRQVVLPRGSTTGRQSGSTPRTASHASTPRRSGRTVLLVAAAAYGVVLVYFSAASVAFFHTPAEVGVVCVLLAAVYSVALRGPLAAASAMPATSQVKHMWRLVAVAAAAWGVGLACVCATYAVGWLHRMRPALLGVSVAYDLSVLAGCALAVSRYGQQTR